MWQCPAQHAHVPALNDVNAERRVSGSLLPGCCGMAAHTARMPEQRPGVAGWLAVCDLASIHRLTNFDRAKVYPALARCALLLGGTLESQRCSIRFADARLAARQLDQLLHHALDKTGIQIEHSGRADLAVCPYSLPRSPHLVSSPQASCEPPVATEITAPDICRRDQTCLEDT